jgi:hypothetical protein
LDQLGSCKDTPFFRPFYIGAPKGPFLPGLSSVVDWITTNILSVVRKMSRYYRDQAGSVVNRPGGSGSVIQDYGYADPDPEKYLQLFRV